MAPSLAAVDLVRPSRPEAGPVSSVEEGPLGALRRELPGFASEASTIFATPLWLETVLQNKLLGGAFRPRAVIARDGRTPCGVLLGCALHVPGFRAFFSPLPRTMSQYGGLSVMPEYAGSREAVTDVIMEKIYEDYDLGLIITPPGHRFAPGPGRRGWTVYPRKTMVVDLTREKEDIWSEVHGQARKGIKRAVKNKVAVDFVKGPEAVPGFFKMLGDVTARTNWELPYGEQFFRDALTRFDRNSVVARALSDGEFVAGAILFFDERAVYCHSYATSEKGRRLQASDLLQWSIINWAKEGRFAAYDLMGGNIPRIAHFKRSFGSAEVGYDFVSFCKNPFIARLERRAFHGML